MKRVIKRSITPVITETEYGMQPQSTNQNQDLIDTHMNRNDIMAEFQTTGSCIDIIKAPRDISVSKNLYRPHTSEHILRKPHLATPPDLNQS